MKKDTRQYSFKKGDTLMLDQVYNILGIIPNDTYDQDDIAESTICNDNDAGETIRFKKNVDISIKVLVYD